MAKQAIKKKTVTRPSVKDLKASLGLNIDSNDLTMSSADKPMEFIPMPTAFYEALKIPGIPMGYLTIVTGWSNTGKSTLKYCLMANCINNGILPIIYETENHFDWKYAVNCGVKATPIYGEVEVEDFDEETGEITGTHKEEQIIDWDGEFIYFNTRKLAARYGDNDYKQSKKTTKKRSVAVLEDIAYSINEFLDYQEEGKIQQPICFIWDSIGSIGSFRSYTSKTGNNMFDAGAITEAFSTIVSHRIPSSKNVASPYTNTMFCVNKIWVDSVSNPMGAPSVELKGGKSFFYNTRLCIHLGGVLKPATTRLEAVAKGEKYNYGIITKVRATKNQLPAPYNLTYEGKFACVHNGIIQEDQLGEYKAKNIGFFLEELNKAGKKAIEAKDVYFEENEEEGPRE